MENQTDQWTWTWTLIGFRRMSWIPIYLRLMERLSLVVHLSGIICIYLSWSFSSRTASLLLMRIFVFSLWLLWTFTFLHFTRCSGLRNLFFLKDRYNTVLLDIEQYGKASAVAMNSVSSWITALITLERLLCILFPLKVS